MSGLTFFNYWLGMGLADFILYSLSAFIVAIAMYQINLSIINDNIVVVIIALLLFGFQMIIFSYSFGFIFSDPLAGNRWFGTIS